MIAELIRTLNVAHARSFRQLTTWTAVGAVLQGVSVVLLVPLLGEVATAGPEAGTRWIAPFVVSSLAYVLITYRTQSRAFGVGVEVANALHHRIGEAVIALPWGWFSAKNRGSLTATTGQSVLQLMSVPAHLLRPALESVLTPAVIVIGLFVLDPVVGVAAALGFALMWLMLRVGRTGAAAADAQRHDAGAEVSERIVEYAQSQHLLRTYGRTGSDAAQLTEALTEQRSAERRLLFRLVPALITYSATVRIVVTVLTVITVAQLLGGSLTATEFLGVVFLTARAADAASVGAELTASFQMARHNLEGVRRVLDVPPLPEPEAPKKPWTNMTGVPAVEFDDVRFSYGETPVLDGVNFALWPGTLTALVGPSGAGKTTVLRLIARYLDIASGSVRVGGVDVREMTTADLTDSLALVFQDVYLFEGTLAENILLAAPDAGEVRLAHAMSVAGLETLADELPDGIHTRIGEGGATLSGGQRQRVSIARAVIKEAPIVIFDEATAALDPENDAIVARALTRLASTSTLLVIAHRMETVQAADRILVLENGRIRGHKAGAVDNASHIS